MGAMSGREQDGSVIAQVRHWMEARGGAWEDCTQEDLERLKAAAGVAVLPAVYVAFLLEFGREMRPPVIGGCFDVQYIASLYPVDSEDYLASLPSGSLVIAEHDGCQANYLPRLDEDDPPVWKIREGAPGEPHAASFSEWIKSLVR
jgi:hypothetical protein